MNIDLWVSVEESEVLVIFSVILDSDGSSCHQITISKSGSTTRDWAIAVFQYGGSVDKDNTPAGQFGFTVLSTHTSAKLIEIKLKCL